MHSIIALDLEGVLIPEIWKQIAKVTGISKLNLTTRDIANYDELMNIRLNVLKEHTITINDIHDIIDTIEPMPGAMDFFMSIRSQTEVILLSDTFKEFFHPIRHKLQFPMIFCNSLTIDTKGIIQGYVMRMENGKFHAVTAFQQLNYHVAAVGDSYNDLAMLQKANHGMFFRPPESITQTYPQFPVFHEFKDVEQALLTALQLPHYAHISSHVSRCERRHCKA